MGLHGIVVATEYIVALLCAETDAVNTAAVVKNFILQSFRGHVTDLSAE